jgi:hypothetical protein
MTYTKKMHESARRETAGKRNIVTDLLDEIERLQGIINAYKILYPNIGDVEIKGTIDSGFGKSTITGWTINGETIK